MLVSTKNTIGRDFTENDFVGRLLKSRSNLGFMIGKDNGTYNYTVVDPLGNVYNKTDDLKSLASTLKFRITSLLSCTRVSSKRIGDVREFDINSNFLETIKISANHFSKCVNAINPNRFLGNASTRCSYGFPACRDNQRIFVTRRNIDKENIESSHFVEISDDEGEVCFYGKYKPSVDSPIQIKIFNNYPNINYIIHGHVYIDGAPITENKLPCGAVEEYDEISGLIKDKNIEYFAVNLKGHGCILCAKTVKQMDKYLDRYKSRPFPEN